MFPEHLITHAQSTLLECRAKHLKIVTAESCTGGLIAALLTEIPGSSDVFERGFVTYSNQAKIKHLNVSINTLERFGAVSKSVSCEMAQGALQNSMADISIAVTGIAGPGGGSDDKPIGLVHIATAHKNGNISHKEYRLGSIGRNEIRLSTVTESLKLLKKAYF
ncbi:MAG: CinA family protein [Pseudomonadota bacterium]